MNIDIDTDYGTMPSSPALTRSLDDPDGGEDILVSLTPEEAFAASWILLRFLSGRSRPLTPLQDRIAGLALFLRDQLPDDLQIPVSRTRRVG